MIAASLLSSEWFTEREPEDQGSTLLTFGYTTNKMKRLRWTSDDIEKFGHLCDELRLINVLDGVPSVILDRNEAGNVQVSRTAGG
jgi:hypothetical protein